MPRIAVIGTGTIGAQTLWQLAKHGADVTGYELYSPGHSRGAAGGETRLFRRVETEHLEYLPVIERADSLWHELEQEAGRKLRSLTGALIIGNPASPTTVTALESASLLGTQAEVISRGDMRRRYPNYRLSKDEMAILDHGAGVIYPERAVRAAADAAVARGARLLRECRVTSISQIGSRVEVVAANGTEVYDKVVLAVGAWTATLVPEIAPHLATRRLVSAWFLPAAGHTIEGMLPYLRTDPNFSYGLPTADALSMKLGVGFPDHLPVKSPDNASANLTEEDLAPLRAVARDLLPSLEDYPMRVAAYFETYTRNRREYMGTLPLMPSVFVCAGFSGKGFKNAPVFGELAARAVLGLAPKIGTAAASILANRGSTSSSEK